jgi:hypothetical protein
LSLQGPVPACAGDGLTRVCRLIYPVFHMHFIGLA